MSEHASKQPKQQKPASHTPSHKEGTNTNIFHQISSQSEQLPLYANNIMRLQSVIGNHEVQRLLADRNSGQSINPVVKTMPENQIQREMTQKDRGIRKKVEGLIKDSKHDEALDVICKAYGFTGDNFEIKVVPPIPGAWATTGGEIKAGAKQTLSIGKNLFSEDFLFIVRTIGHEFQHLEQRSQKEPILNQKEREFLAWAWEALDTSVPTYGTKVAAFHAKKALEYYKDMPADTQTKYEAKKKELDDLIKKANDLKNPHTVARGDSLWKIASIFYGDGARWPEIYKENKALIGADPNHIEVGWELRIPGA